MYFSFFPGQSTDICTLMLNFLFIFIIIIIFVYIQINFGETLYIYVYSVWKSLKIKL